MALIHHVDVAHVAWSVAVRTFEVHKFTLQPKSYSTLTQQQHINADERPS